MVVHVYGCNLWHKYNENWNCNTLKVWCFFKRLIIIGQDFMTYMCKDSLINGHISCLWLRIPRQATWVSVRYKLGFVPLCAPHVEKHCPRKDHSVYIELLDELYSEDNFGFYDYHRILIEKFKKEDTEPWRH